MVITSNKIYGLTKKEVVKIKEIVTSKKMMNRFGMNSVVKINIDTMTDNIHSKHYSVTVSDYIKDVTIRLALQL